MTSSYPPTLRSWRRNFEAASGRLAELGYDRRFQRLWELYLCWSEAGFEERWIQDYQQLLVAAPPRPAPVRRELSLAVRG